MSNLDSAWLVLPTYEEAQNIGKVLEYVALIKVNIHDHELHVVVVDGNSPDGTGDIVRSAIMDGYKNLHLVLEPKRGLGHAYDTGFEYAKSHGADVLIEMDSDLSHNPAEIPRLLKEIKNGADLVIGSRYINGGFIPGDWPVKRVVNSKVARYVARKAGAVSDTISDPTAGFKAIRVGALEDINFVAGGASGYAIQVKMVDEMYTNGYVIKEIPISFSDRKFGESKIRSKDVGQFIWFCFSLRLQKIFNTTKKNTMVGGVMVSAITKPDNQDNSN